ncbi:hypothetical protein ACEN2J_08260 [Pseudorhodobacter sp. W20_MBD10_FR17]|uniref:hypothetical protein n=1 Tax=Pseudorhodobacter sp. W20_MBD10_FR17 TaxID=3240266 RepID=UPI003F9D2ECC
MSGVFTALLGVQGVVFVLWTVHAFRCLFKLRAQVVAETGNLWPGPKVALRSFGRFAVAPGYQRDRRILIGLTVILFALIGAVALVSGQIPR